MPRWHPSKTCRVRLEGPGTSRSQNVTVSAVPSAPRGPPGRHLRGLGRQHVEHSPPRRQLPCRRYKEQSAPLRYVAGGLRFDFFRMDGARAQIREYSPRPRERSG
jgi:hypothetical protein